MLEALASTPFLVSVLDVEYLSDLFPLCPVSGLHGQAELERQGVSDDQLDSFGRREFQREIGEVDSPHSSVRGSVEGAVK